MINESSDSLKCADVEFACSLSGFCIHKDWLCDGIDDCDDHSDELDCGKYVLLFVVSTYSKHVFFKKREINPRLFSSLLLMLINDIIIKD